MWAENIFSKDEAEEPSKPVKSKSKQFKEG